MLWAQCVLPRRLWPAHCAAAAAQPRDKRLATTTANNKQVSRADTLQATTETCPALPHSITPARAVRAPGAAAALRPERQCARSVLGAKGAEAPPRRKRAHGADWFENFTAVSFWRCFEISSFCPYRPCIVDALRRALERERVECSSGRGGLRGVSAVTTTRGWPVCVCVRERTGLFSPACGLFQSAQKREKERAQGAQQSAEKARKQLIPAHAGSARDKAGSSGSHWTAASANFFEDGDSGSQAAKGAAAPRSDCAAARLGRLCAQVRQRGRGRAVDRGRRAPRIASTAFVEHAAASASASSASVRALALE